MPRSLWGAELDPACCDNFRLKLTSDFTEAASWPSACCSAASAEVDVFVPAEASCRAVLLHRFLVILVGANWALPRLCVCRIEIREK